MVSRYIWQSSLDSKGTFQKQRDCSLLGAEEFLWPGQFLEQVGSLGGAFLKSNCHYDPYGGAVEGSWLPQEALSQNNLLHSFMGRRGMKKTFTYSILV